MDFRRPILQTYFPFLDKNNKLIFFDFKQSIFHPIKFDPITIIKDNL